MKKEIKRITVGVIFTLFLFIMSLLSITLENVEFTFGLLWDAFILTMISIGIAIICGVIVYLLVIWIEK